MDTRDFSNENRGDFHVVPRVAGWFSKKRSFVGRLYPGAAGATFGLLRQTVVRDVGLGTSRQIQFALRLNF